MVHGFGIVDFINVKQPDWGRLSFLYCHFICILVCPADCKIKVLPFWQVLLAA